MAEPKHVHMPPDSLKTGDEAILRKMVKEIEELPEAKRRNVIFVLLSFWHKHKKGEKLEYRV